MQNLDLDLVRDDEPPSISPSLAVPLIPDREEGKCNHDNLKSNLDHPRKLKMSKIIPDDRTSANPQEWNSWMWQMSHRVRNADELCLLLKCGKLSEGTVSAAARFPMAISPYYASLIQKADPSDPIFQMAVPVGEELIDPSFLMDDPLEEEHDMPVPGLVHRYPDRALLVATSTCAMYCRHCTRKRIAGQHEVTMPQKQLAHVVAYLRDHPEIHDVIISGGDPFTMTTPQLERFISAVRNVPSVDIIRIGTRTPVTLPMRINNELVNMLRKYQPIWVNTHFNHPNEITPEAIEACARLVDAGIPVGNQSVLLKGVNDDPVIMEDLCRKLVKMRVRPYYLFQCDLVRGVEHFRTPLSRGIQIMEYLRGRLSGLAIPTFVLDAPGGGGKLPLLPTYIVSTSPTHTVLRNFEGMLISYPEPMVQGDGYARVEEPALNPMVADLANGSAKKIVPSHMARTERRILHSDLAGKTDREC